MRVLIASLVIIAGLAPAQGQRTFSGVITDDMCAAGDHSRMRMGPSNHECTIACVDAHGAAFVLYDGKLVYGLSDQKTPEKFAGKNVTVMGVVNATTRMIQVESIVESTK